MLFSEIDIRSHLSQTCFAARQAPLPAPGDMRPYHRPSRACATGCPKVGSRAGAEDPGQFFVFPRALGPMILRSYSRRSNPMNTAHAAATPTNHTNYCYWSATSQKPKSHTRDQTPRNPSAHSLANYSIAIRRYSFLRKQTLPEKKRN
jgi:hypothetical protein